MTSRQQIAEVLSLGVERVAWRGAWLHLVLVGVMVVLLSRAVMVGGLGCRLGTMVGPFQRGIHWLAPADIVVPLEGQVGWNPEDSQGEDRCEDIESASVSSPD